MNYVSLDPILHGAELLVIVGAAWRILRLLNRIYDILQDFPPHRHVNDKIIYPKGYDVRGA